MAFNYPPIDTNEKLQRYIDGDPKLTDGRSPFSQLPNSEKYTKFLGRHGGYQSNEFRISGPRMALLESLEGIRFPERVINMGETKVLWIVNTNIHRLDNANFPNLLELNLMRNQINSLNGVRFPESLRYLTIENEPIQTLEGVQFPSNLAELHISGSRITTIKGITFPSKLTSLNLSNNQIVSFDGMKFPPLLEHLYLDNNPLFDNIQTISLLENPSETVIRDIIRAYPQTAEYFEQQKESDKLTIGKLQNHIRSITAFLQPLIVERKAKEEAKLTEGTPRLFVENEINNNTYTIPFIASQTVQTAIDYLEQNYLLSVTNSYVKIKLTKRSDNTVLDPLRTFADFSIQNEDTLNVVQDNSSDAVRVSRGGKHQNKTKRKRKHSRSGRR